MLQELAGELCASQVQVVIGVALFLLKLKIAGHAKFYAKVRLWMEWKSPTLKCGLNKAIHKCGWSFTCAGGPRAPPKSALNKHQ
jgi:hypothetical protein